MEGLRKNWKYIVEAMLLMLSLLLTWLHIGDLGWPGIMMVALYLAWVVYFVLQLKAKLGLTLPFAFIIIWMISATLEWNDNQDAHSFDLRDYKLAVAFVLNALNGAVIYFENKMRW
jgi:hypothetical protein